MSDDRYRFTVGDVECLAIKDAENTSETRQLFSNIDEKKYQAALKTQGDNPEIAILSCNPLAVFSDDWVLIDTGFGAMATPNGQSVDILNDEDIRPEHIILSHAHGDHYGGLLNKNGDENFSNVPVYMCQNEWMFYTSGEYADANPQRAERVQKYLLPAERQIERIECLNMSEILPGFTVLKLPGHTPHHIGILVESMGETLIVAGDTALHPLHLAHLDWEFANDADHDTARESRLKLAELAIELDALVMFYHFPFPGLGRIERNGAGYRWVPLAI